MRPALLLLALALAACGQPVGVTNNATEEKEASAGDTMTPGTLPVRIGELGANFEACPAAGTTRNLRAGDSLPVRAAPFDNAAEQGGIPAGGRFFVCTRSLDQKWFGIVFDADGRLADRCGVAEPVARRRDYAGPCASGWVQSAFVKLISGLDQSVPAIPATAAQRPAPRAGG
jgi:hypothetical protein